MPAWLDGLFDVACELALAFVFGYEVAMRQAKRELDETEARWFDLLVSAVDGRPRKGGGNG